MKTNVIVLALSLIYAGASFAAVDVRLDYESNNLLFATQQLISTIRACQGESHVVQDAETLSDAAEHFKEEVELGPIDLPQDFQILTETYNEMRRELIHSNEIRYNRSARTAWFDTEEAFIRLRLAWLAHGDPNGGGDGDGGFGGFGGGRF